MDHVTQYYKGLFGPVEPRQIFLGNQFWEEGRKVKKEDKDDLVKMFTQEEVRSAMMGMKKDAAPGPNRFGASFFIHFGISLRIDIMLCFKIFTEGI
jgi:hypothetical protein